MYKYPEKERKNHASLLSATRPNTILSTANKQTQRQTRTIQKRKLLVFVDAETHKTYIEHAAAYALHLTNVRTIMTSTPKLVEILGETLENLKKDPSYEIEYQELPKKSKQKIVVFYDNSKLFISSAAAYALGMIDVKKFYLNDNIYGPLSTEEETRIKTNFQVEFQKLPTPVDELQEMSQVSK